MLDIKLIRQNRDLIERKLRTKEADISLALVCELDEKIREAKTRAEALKAARNEISKRVGDIKRQQGDATALMNEAHAAGEEISQLDHSLRTWEEQFTHELAKLPNLPMEDVKVSPDKNDNQEISSFGQQRKFDFVPKNHMELGEALKLFDFERGTKLTGSGWPIYRGLGARLEWALINYMLDTHIKNGFTQWMLPLVVKPDVLFASGQLPKFENQQYKLDDADYPFYMIPTAEVPLNGLHIDEILDEEKLPLKYTAYTPCFRREAGAAGERERGLIRVHQFNKVEMFIFCRPEDSMEMFQLMVHSAEQILQGLELHYRNMLLVTGDMSFGAARTLDVECWLPGQNRYYEVSSISNCTDYQARRSRTRFRRKGEKPELVHTLNGSGLATSRLMVSLLENNQQADGSVVVPKALRPYLGGLEKILP